MKRILFIDRDGTLIEEPADEQIDAFEKLKFTQGVFRNLHFIRQHTDFEFVMVSNQDGLGTDAFPENTFWPVHNFILQTLEGEGITFDDILIDRHFPEDNAPTRKPNTGLVEKYMQNPDYDIANSYVIGDRETDRTFAQNIGCKSLILSDEGITWTKADTAKNQLPESYQARQKLSAVVRDNNIYIFGGEDSERTYSDAYKGRLNSIDW